VKREPEWDDRFSAAVGVFLFSRDGVVGRDPKFAAAELWPVFKEHLFAVVANAPTRLSMSTGIREVKYDFASQTINFVPLKQGSNTTRNNSNPSDLLRPISQPNLTEHDVAYPESVQNSVFYNWSPTGQSEPKYRKPLSSGGGDERLIISAWRRLMRDHRVREIALDRRLVMPAFPMAPEDAEPLLIKIKSHGLEARVVFDAIRTVVGKHYDFLNPGGPSPVLFAKLVRVDIFAGGEIITSFGPEQFPSATDLFAAAEAKAAKEAQTKRSAAQQAALIAQNEKDRLIAQCEASGSQFAQLECKMKTMCESHYKLFGRDECSNVKQDYQTAARAVEYCRNRFRRFPKNAGAPIEGTPDFEAAVEACLSDPQRQPYGPDIVNLRLGMVDYEAQSVATQRFATNGVKSSRHEKPGPFEGATLYWDRKTADQGIALFTIMSRGGNRVAGISRRLYFGEDGPSKTQILGKLRGKYGVETLAKGDALLWAFPQDSQTFSKITCSAALELVAPRGGWQTEWRPADALPDYQAQYKNLQTDSMQIQGQLMQCMSQVQAKYAPEFASGDRTKIELASAKIQLEIQACQKKPVAAAAVPPSASSPPEAVEVRMPLMIGSGGNPENYEKLKMCGPIIITIINADGDQVKDASFALFDPGWIGRQPGFLFVGDEQAVAEGKLKDIEF
jgi:hypothetical protein